VRIFFIYNPLSKVIGYTVYFFPSVYYIYIYKNGYRALRYHLPMVGRRPEF